MSKKQKLAILSALALASALVIFGDAGIAAQEVEAAGGDMAVQASAAGKVVVATDGSGDYTSIQDAVDDLQPSEILVMPGEYKEDIRVARSVTIRSYDGPLTTVVSGTAPGQTDTVRVSPGSTVVLEGLTITNGQDGIEIEKGAHVTLRNCVLWGNQANGVKIADKWPALQPPTTLIHNCVIFRNDGSGIWVGYKDGDAYAYPPLTVRNSVIVMNGIWGITLTYADPRNTSISLDYNCYAGNVSGPHDGRIGPGKDVQEGPHTIYGGPQFIDPDHGDFRLLSTSPCINAGSPGWGSMDPDGTQNNMGAYGGPWCLTFFENPTDGPIVRNVRVSPGSVPQGSLLIIEADGSVRQSALSKTECDTLQIGGTDMRIWNSIAFAVAGVVLLTSFGSVCRAEGTVAGAEYFVDEDPGPGAALALSPSDGAWDANSETATQSVDTSGLSVGPHLLGVRFRKSDGTWSYMRKTWFYVTGPTILDSAEWFVDIDPGKGQGTPIGLPADGVWDEPEEEVRLDSVDVSQLSTGVHTVFVRFRDSDGNWGLTRRASFEVRPDPYIVAAEWTTDPSFEPATTNEMYTWDGQFDGAAEELVSDEVDLTSYDCVYVRVQDNLGRWSSRGGLVREEAGEWVFDPILAWNRENMLALNGFLCIYSTYDDWVAFGRPACWGFPPFGSGCQCDGDADGKHSGVPFRCRVFTGDLNVLVENWRKKITDPTLNPCADLDHKDSGPPFRFRVFTQDLGILVDNWKKKDADLAGDCPRPE